MKAITSWEIRAKFETEIKMLGKDEFKSRASLSDETFSQTCKCMQPLSIGIIYRNVESPNKDRKNQGND